MSSSGYRKWMPHNIAIIKKATQQKINLLSSKMLLVLYSVAEKIVSEIDSGLIPEYTANLHDATGVGVYYRGGLRKFIPTKRATRSQSSGFHNNNEYDINGSEYLNQALSDASNEFNEGMWIVIFSAVPYAWFINSEGSPIGRGKDFFETLSKLSISEIMSNLKKLNISYSTTMNSFSKLP